MEDPTSISVWATRIALSRLFIKKKRYEAGSGDEGDLGGTEV